jgi:hypothetical protein
VSSYSLLCAFSSSTFYALCTMSILCAMPPHALHCATVLLFRLFTTYHPPHSVASNRINTLFSVLHIFSRLSPLHDHHNNSSSSLAVMLNVFIISGCFLRFLDFSGSLNSSSSLSVTTSRLWLLWLLSLFLHMTTDDDQTPIQKALPDLGLVSASSVSRYDLGL